MIRFNDKEKIKTISRLVFDPAGLNPQFFDSTTCKLPLHLKAEIKISESENFLMDAVI